MRGVLGLGRVVQDGASQAIARVQVVLSQVKKGRFLASRLAVRRDIAGQRINLCRLAHDHMTIGDRETFNRSPRPHEAAQDGVRYPLARSAPP